MAYTSLKVKQEWYFDSGSSRHMTGNKEFFTNLQPCNLESVRFGDGAKGPVIGSGLLKVPCMLKLENVLLVNRLKVNLISISQLCDQNLFIKFTKDKCSVTDSTNACVMEGKRSSDNSDIWHRRLSHINPKSLNETIVGDPILGIPKMEIDLEKVCNPYQIRKQIRTSHKMMQHPSTTRVLELLHMNLMGPMQVENLGGKRYVLMTTQDSCG